jgi:uncharacterized protein (DUF2252 family)
MRIRRNPVVALVLFLACFSSGCGSFELGGGGGPAISPGKADGMDATEREEWLLGELASWNSGLSEADRGKKFDKMAKSAFRFFRGSNHVFWADHANDARVVLYGDWDTRIWVQGDLHTDNFGAFARFDETIVYHMNDFDEAMLADYQMDLWRMGTSLVLVGRDLNFDEEALHGVLDEFSGAYLAALSGYMDNDEEVAKSFTAESTRGLLHDFLQMVAEEESRGKLLDKWTEMDGEGERVLDTSLEKLEELEPEMEQALLAGVEDYARRLATPVRLDAGYFRVKSTARRLNAGTGSLGKPRFYALVEGPSGDPDDDVILDIKRQDGPSGLSFLGGWDQKEYAAMFGNHAERVVEGAQALCVDHDIHLGWLAMADGKYTVVEKSPFDEGFDTDDLESVEELGAMARQWAEVLATGHARADSDTGSVKWLPRSFEEAVDERVAGDRAGFQALVRQVAVFYANVVEQDYGFFFDWVNEG